MQAFPASGLKWVSCTLPLPERRRRGRPGKEGPEPRSRANRMWSPELIGVFNTAVRDLVAQGKPVTAKRVEASMREIGLPEGDTDLSRSRVDHRLDACRRRMTAPGPTRAYKKWSPALVAVFNAAVQRLADQGQPLTVRDVRDAMLKMGLPDGETALSLGRVRERMDRAGIRRSTRRRYKKWSRELSGVLETAVRRLSAAGIKPTAQRVMHEMHEIGLPAGHPLPSRRTVFDRLRTYKLHMACGSMNG